MKRFIETLKVSCNDETFHEPKFHETFAKFHKNKCACALMPGWGYLRLKYNKKILENGSPEAQINSKTINLRKENTK